MEKLLATVLCLTMLLTLASFAYADGVTYSNPGTYTATAVGKNGDVTVTATFSETAIEAIEVTEAETPTLGGAAIEDMTAQTLREQTLTPDAVSGATESSMAFLKALADADAQAGASEIGEVQAPAAAEADYSVTDADVIVVGAGGAGLTAAYTAAEKGVSVIVIEKSGVVGGNSLCSQQGINAANSKVQEALGMELATAENLKTAQMSYGGREELVDAYVKASGETVDWFADTLGIQFTGKTGDKVDPNDPLASVLTDHPGGFMTSAIFVNQDAQRYTSEGFEVSDDTLKQEAAYAIFGEADLNDTLKLLAGHRSETLAQMIAVSKSTGCVFCGSKLCAASLW